MSAASRERSTIRLRNTAPVRSSVCLSVQEIGFRDFVQIAVHVLSFACGNTLPLRRCTGTKIDTRLFFFCFCPPARLLDFLHNAFRRCVIVSRKDRSGTDRATGNKTAPSTVLLEALCIYIDRHGPPPRPLHTLSKGRVSHTKVSRCPLSLPFPRKPRLSARWPYVLARSHPVFRYEADFEGGYQFRSNGLDRRRIGSRVLETGEGHFAPPNLLRFAKRHGHYAQQFAVQNPKETALILRRRLSGQLVFKSLNVCEKTRCKCKRNKFDGIRLGKKKVTNGFFFKTPSR